MICLCLTQLGWSWPLLQQAREFFASMPKIPWVNWTYTYTPISKAELMEKMKEAYAKYGMEPPLEPPEVE